MAERVITAEQWGKVLQDRINADTELLSKAALGAVLRGVAEASKMTVKEGLVDRGSFLKAWEAGQDGRDAYLRNSAPYAGVLEYGRRPGAPGPPFEPILEWVERKLVGNGEIEPEEAVDIAWAIRNKIHHDGSPPHFILRDVSGKLRGYLRKEALRLLRRKTKK